MNEPPSPSADFFDRMLGAEAADGAEKAVAATNTEPDASASPTPAPGDPMPTEARRALVSLLRQGVVLAAQKAKLFASLCRYQKQVRNHLSAVYLRLVLDEKNGIAFIAHAQTDDVDEEGESISLISKRTLTLYDTLLLLVLRKHYQERESQGEQKVIIDVERIEANLSPFLPLSNSAKSDRQKLVPSLKRMIDKKILTVVRGNQDRFEISPLIRYVVSAEFLETMLAEYARLATAQGTTSATDEAEHD